MWTLFTKALTRGHSTTQVSILNTSSNFVLTALMGFIVFSESLPPLWWLGAAMLVAGNVIVGRKDEGIPGSGDDADGADGAAASDAESGNGGYEHVPQEEGLDLGDEVKDDEDVPDLGELPETERI